VPPGRALAVHEKTAPAAGKRQQNHASGNGETPSTRHARKNASSFFNEASTLRSHEFVKDKDSLPPDARGGRTLLSRTRSRHPGEALARLHMQFFAIVFTCIFATVAPARHCDTADWTTIRDDFAPKVVAGRLLHR
jgi:hypothetical protein